MKVFVRAITTGFALSLGAAIFRKVSKYIGLDDKKPEDKAKEAEEKNPATSPVGADGATDPNLRHNN